MTLRFSRFTETSSLLVAGIMLASFGGICLSAQQARAQAQTLESLQAQTAPMAETPAAAPAGEPATAAPVAVEAPAEDQAAPVIVPEPAPAPVQEKVRKRTHSAVHKKPKRNTEVEKAKVWDPATQSVVTSPTGIEPPEAAAANGPAKSGVPAKHKKRKHKNAAAPVKAEIAAPVAETSDAPVAPEAQIPVTAPAEAAPTAPVAPIAPEAGIPPQPQPSPAAEAPMVPVAQPDGGTAQ